MTWGHANGDPPNCSFFPDICTYAGMQYHLRQSYLQMTQDNQAIVAPVGAAWEVMMDSFASSIWLYVPDSTHPDLAGSYLESCVIYSSIFHKPTQGTTDSAGLSTFVASTIHRISDRVVLDSLGQWQQYGHYPYAGFSAGCALDTTVFTSGAVINQMNSWKFGDGSVSTDTTLITTHLYADSGTYTVSHTAYNTCFTETLAQTIDIHCLPSTETRAARAESGQAAITQIGPDRVAISVSTNNGIPVYSSVFLFDMLGRKVAAIALNNRQTLISLNAGMYMARFTGVIGSALVKFEVH
jgi:hypothetical protein